MSKLLSYGPNLPRSGRQDLAQVAKERMTGVFGAAPQQEAKRRPSIVEEKIQTVSPSISPQGQKLGA